MNQDQRTQSDNLARGLIAKLNIETSEIIQNRTANFRLLGITYVVALSILLFLF